MMTPACRLLQMRDREPRHVEHGGEIDRDHLVPVVRRIIGDRQRHAGNAGIVDQHVEPAEILDRVRHHALDLGAARHVARPRDQAGDFFGKRIKRGGVDVADKDARAARGKGAREFAADAGSTGSDQDPLRHCFLLLACRNFICGHARRQALPVFRHPEVAAQRPSKGARPRHPGRRPSRLAELLAPQGDGKGLRIAPDSVNEI